MLNRSRPAILAFILALLISGRTASTPANAAQDELRVGLSSLGNEALDPIRGPNDNGNYIRLIYDQLVGVDPAGQSISKATGIAEDWKISPDGKTYTFTVRKGVKFHNGMDVTAEDAAFSLTRFGSPESVSTTGRLVASLIESVKVNGRNELQVLLKNPYPTFLIAISPLVDLVSSVVPKAYVESVGLEAFARAPIGSGPYKLTEQKTGALLRFEQAAPDHFAGKPKYKRVTISLVPEENTRLSLLKTKQLDFTDLGRASVGDAEKSGFKIFAHPNLETFSMVWQMQRPGEATRDINLRRALSTSIDREGINKSILQGKGVVTGNLFIGQTGMESLAPFPYDVQKAKEYLARTSYGPGKQPLNLQIQATVQRSWPEMLSIVAVIADGWKKIGIDSTITYRDYASYRAQWNAEKLPAPSVAFNIFSGRADWSSQAASMLRCGTKSLPQVCEPQLDALLNTWVSSKDEASYVQAGRAVERSVYENLYHVPIVAAAPLYAGNDQVPASYSPGNIARGIFIRGLVTSK